MRSPTAAPSIIVPRMSLCGAASELAAAGSGLEAATDGFAPPTITVPRILSPAGRGLDGATRDRSSLSTDRPSAARLLRQQVFVRTR